MTATESPWVLPIGRAQRPGSDVVVDASLPGWQHTGLYVVPLASGQTWSTEQAGWEYVVVPLSGSALISCVHVAGTEPGATLRGRSSVFAGRTDVAYAPAGSRLTLTGSGQESRIAVCAARVR